jgi:peptidoglycan/LPS O-acetylase OafA/YrhL
MNLKIKRLTEITMGAGLLGHCLRLLLYRIGFDEKNILSSSHPLQIACLALTLLTAVYLAFSLRRPGNTPAKNPPRFLLVRLGMLAAAVLSVLHGLELTRKPGDLLDTARTALAFGGAVSMALCALPGTNRKLRAAGLGIITVFYALDMLCRYTDWSGNPQLPDYVFQVFACALLALTSYHHLAFDVEMGKRRTLLFCSLMGLFLCLLCAAGPDTRPFYLGGACWAGACMYAPDFSAKNEPEETP